MMKSNRVPHYEPVEYWGDIVGSVYVDKKGCHFFPAIPYTHYALLQDLREAPFPDRLTLDAMLDCRLYETEDVQRKMEEAYRQIKEEEK